MASANKKKPSGLAAAIVERVRSTQPSGTRCFLAKLPPDVQQELKALREMWGNGELAGYTAKTVYEETKALLADRGVDLTVVPDSFRRFLRGELG